MAGSRDDSTVSNPDIAQHARRVIEANRRLRAAVGEEGATSQVLDILLFLLAEDQGDGVTTGRCCGAVSVPRTTALRWIRTLESGGLVEQFNDATDGRVALLKITPKTREALTSWLCAVANPAPFER